jgi:hypothetical protein
MNKDGLGKIRRVELLARLTHLEQMISEQAGRAKFIRQKGWDARTADRRLELLVDSHRLYLRSLSHLVGERLDEARTTGGASDGLVPGPID